MILQQLYNDAEAIYNAVYQRDMPPPMYDERKVDWLIPLSAAGELIGDPIPLNGARHLMPYNYGRTSTEKIPNLLFDDAAYALGIMDKAASEKHSKFRMLLQHCADVTNDPLVQAVIVFLASGGLPKDKIPSSLRYEEQKKDSITFTVDGDWPTASPSVRAFWAELTLRECKGEPKQQGQCLVSGQTDFLETILPGKISISGENAPVISVDKSFKNSYGFQQALHGGVCRDAAEGFTKALNALMRGENTHITYRLSPPKKTERKELVYVFWSSEGADEDILEALERPGPDVVERLMKSVFTAKAEKTVDVEQFHALALTGNKTRVVFRDWLSTTLPTAKANLLEWLDAQRITSWDGLEEKQFGVGSLARALYRADEKGANVEKVASHALRGLLRVALYGDPVPRELLARAVSRCRAEPEASFYLWSVRAALMKAALTFRKEDYKFMAGLDENCTDPPYICGRLMAVLESIQYQAQGDQNSTIIDRFFSMAAVTPQRAMSVLLQKAEKAYLPKIRKQRGIGAYLGQKEQLERLLDSLSPDNDSPERCPSTLSVEQQAIFMLGYYHQRSAFTHARKENAERKRKADAFKQLTPLEAEEENELDA